MLICFQRFRRVNYEIGGAIFCPDDVEHGILRGNATPPNSLFRRFSGDDPRIAYSVEMPDHRIHFALVCASSSCPPIEVYTPDGIHDQLDISAKTFINTGGAVIDRERRAVGLSRIFKWYAPDFGDRQSIIKLVADYMYKDRDRLFLTDNQDSIYLYCLDYDWRLNRTN